MKSKDIDIMLTRKELYSIGQLSEQGNFNYFVTYYRNANKYSNDR